MDLGRSGKVSHIFYIMLVILCSLIIINIIERKLLETIENKKKEINPLYYDRILNNLKQAKIILFILLFAIFIVLINPIKMLSIFNINIYSILTDQYTDIIKIVNKIGGCNDDIKYIEKKTNLGVLDKTIKEIIMNTKDEDIYNRIRSEIPGTDSKQDLCNLINSIDLENKLSHLDENEFKSIINTNANNATKLKTNEKEVYTLLNEKFDNIVTNKLEPFTLDTTQYKKFETFNKIIKRTLNLDISTKEDPDLLYIMLLIFYYVFELLYEIHSFMIAEKKAITNNVTIVAAGNNEAVNTATIIFNIIIFITLLRILNDKKWLSHTGLSTINTNKYIPLLLFTSNIICKIYFKYSKYITYDSFLFIKLISLISNLGGVLLVCAYFGGYIKSGNTKEQPLFEYLWDEWKWESKDYFSTFETLLKTPMLIFPIFIIISSLYLININYYDRKIAKNSDVSFLTDYAYKLKYNSDRSSLLKTHMGVLDFTFLGINDSGLFYFISILIICGNIGIYGGQLYRIITTWGDEGDTITACTFVAVCCVVPIVLGAVLPLTLDTNDFFLKFDKTVTSDTIDSKLEHVYFSIIIIIISYIIMLGLFLYQPFVDVKLLIDSPEWGVLVMGLLVNIAWMFVVRQNEPITKNLLSIVIFTALLLLNTVIRYYLNPREEGTGLLDKIAQKGGAINSLSITENKISNIVKYIIIGLSCMLLYKLFINYKKEVNQKKIKHTKEINGGGSNDQLDNMGDVTYNIKPTDVIDGQIIQLVIAVVILILLYASGILQTTDLSNFIQYQVFASSNLNILRLLFFPFIIIAIISIIGGGKFFKSFILRYVEKNSIGNFDSDPDKTTKIEETLIKNNSNKFIDKKNSGDELVSAHTIRIAKYIFLAFIIMWYLFLLYRGRIALSPILLINISIIVIYVYFIINVIYIFYKIYMNENVNNITQEVDKLSEIKNKIKFRKGKINPELLSEIIEINTDKFKDKYEQFIFEMYKNVYDLLSINNIYLTEHIANYIKIKLIKHNKLEEEFSLVNSDAEKTSTQNPIKLDINGKWINRKNKNNIILYVYNNKVGIVIYLNETSYNNMKMIDVVFKDSTYEFFSENKLLFTYTDEKIMLNDIEYTRLSNEFSTDNIIKKTLADNDVFKNLNYMVSIDKDSKFIGKYNLVENLTTYNVYKNNGDPLATELEEIILNKVLLIKAIRDKKYKEAEEFNSKLNVLESTFKKKMMFNKFDSNLDGTIDFNEINNYVGKNYKLSEPNFVKIKSAIFDGANLIIQFDKKITSDNTFKKLNNSIVTDIDLISDLFDLKINGELFDNGETSNTGNFILPYENVFEGSGIYNIGTSHATAKYEFKINSNNYFNDDVHYIKILENPTAGDASPSAFDGDKTSANNKASGNTIVKTDVFKLTPDNKINTFTIIKRDAGDYTAASDHSNTVFKNYDKIKFRIVTKTGALLSKKTVNKNNTNIEIVNNDTLKIKLTDDAIQKLNTSNDIKLRIKNQYNIIISENIFITATTLSSNEFTLEDSASVIKDDKIYYPYDVDNGLKPTTADDISRWKKDSYYKVKTNSNGKITLKTETVSDVVAFSTTIPSTDLPAILKKIKMTRTLKRAEKKIHKTINNFEEFDNSIFGT